MPWTRVTWERRDAMSEFGDLLVGSWNDPHMLAACVGSLRYIYNDSDKHALFKGRHRPWVRYAVENQIAALGVPISGRIRGDNGFEHNGF